jgi:ribonuclease inhibitor
MHTIAIDCSGFQSPDDLWQRYIDEAKPMAPEQFGRNLDAFWDAVERATHRGTLET